METERHEIIIQPLGLSGYYAMPLPVDRGSIYQTAIPPQLWTYGKRRKSGKRGHRKKIMSNVFAVNSAISVKYVNLHKKNVRMDIYLGWVSDKTGEYEKRAVISELVGSSVYAEGVAPDKKMPYRKAWRIDLNFVSEHEQRLIMIISDVSTGEELSGSSFYRFYVSGNYKTTTVNGTTDRIVVITVPHGACAAVKPWNNNEDHLCDSGAERAARCIRNLINRQKAGVRAILYLNKDLPRRLCDLNRSRCRNTAYRRGLRKLVQNNSNIDFVLDIHSFPGGENAWNLGDRHPDPELLILDDDYGRNLQISKLPDYVIKFLKTMRSKGIYTAVLPGIMNDIQNTMRHQEGIKSILLEVRENLSAKRLENLICPAVAKWLINSKF